MQFKKFATNYIAQVVLGILAFVVIQALVSSGIVSEEQLNTAIDGVASAESAQQAMDAAISDILEPSLTTRPSPSIAASDAAFTPGTTTAQVVSITDGDTIKVAVAGGGTEGGGAAGGAESAAQTTTETVRIVGINTPETVDPRKPVECFGREASERMKELVLGKTVILETDPTQSDRDRYNRLLRFVFLPDGRDVGLILIQEGYAQESLYSSDPHKYYEEYVAGEREARSGERGLWNLSACPPEKTE